MRGSRTSGRNLMDTLSGSDQRAASQCSAACEDGDRLNPVIPHMSRIPNSEVVSKISDIVARECLTVFGSRLISVILTGSAARGEATIVGSRDGWKILGDAEFLVVLHRAEGATNSRSAEAVKRESAEKLHLQGIEVSISLGLVSVSYLKGLPAYIFSYELRERGRVICGNPQILDVIPKFAASAISREDAWRLLCNRLIEQLALVGDLERTPQQLTDGLHYATVKLYLDMATSYLVFAGAYEPTYRGRAERLSILASHSDDGAPFPLKDFEARIADCTSWKLGGAEDGRDRSVQFWREAVSFAHQLWRWEIMQMTGASENSSDSDLWTTLAAAITLSERIRGWLSVTKRSSVAEVFRNFPRWLKLGRRATPRYWIYRAGTEVVFNLPTLVTAPGAKAPPNFAGSRLVSILACRLKPGTAEISWETVANEITANYWKYVAETRA